MYTKNAIMRALLGFPLGITIGVAILICVSYILGTGELHPTVPAMTASVGSELNAATVQFVLCGLLGSVFAASSVFFEVETWGILKRTLVHFAITSVTMLGIAYICQWMEHNLVSVLIYSVGFIVLYAIIWAAQMLGWRLHVKAINAKLG